MARMTIKPMFAWYDLWIGVFVDAAKRRIYVFPLPCLGVMIQLGKGSRWQITTRDLNY
jgi:hypothetical protein